MFRHLDRIRIGLPWNIPKGFVLERVISVTDTCKEEPVYDMTTEAHEFIANDILVHNCHQAVSFIDKTVDLQEAGHGPLWQAWMKRVGLDPRRFDPTEDVVYMDKAAQSLTEESYTRFYGHRASQAELNKLEPAPMYSNQTVLVDIHGRLFTGKFTKVAKGYSFTGQAPNKKEFGFLFRQFPSSKVYKS